jgi:uncharacterized protein YcbK (DUF882 family)
LLPIVLKLRLLTMAMAGWASASSPVPVPMGAYAIVLAARAAEPVPVKLYDENMRQSATVAIERDGEMDVATTKLVEKLFRCRRTYRERAISRATLVMLTDIAERYPTRTVEYVSVYRTGSEESQTSPHRAGRAIDFRIRGESLVAIRDYLWKTYPHTGIGWYPSEQFIHMDARPGQDDMSWTFLNGDNHYHPYWAERARAPRDSHERRPGS